MARSLSLENWSIDDRIAGLNKLTPLSYQCFRADFSRRLSTALFPHPFLIPRPLTHPTRKHTRSQASNTSRIPSRRPPCCVPREPGCSRRTMKRGVRAGPYPEEQWSKDRSWCSRGGSSAPRGGSDPGSRRVGLYARR